MNEQRIRAEAEIEGDGKAPGGTFAENVTVRSIIARTFARIVRAI